MIIINLIGGLGNQMFQYAFGYTLAKQNDTILKLDIHDFESYKLRNYKLDRYNIKEQLATKEEVALLKQEGKSYNEKAFCFNKLDNNLNGDFYFKGYWQSEEYFLSCRDDIKKQFILKNTLSSEVICYEHLIKNKITSVSLHVRRGDYVTCPKTNSVHGTCSLEYYYDSFNLIEKQYMSSHYFIFSDDIKWCKQNLEFIKNKTFIELSANERDHEEMYLMSQCKHNIIANSSFSWWGAWLNQNPDKTVIAPKKWFHDEQINTNDLIPDTWIRV